MALLDEAGEIAVVSLACAERFPSVGRHHPPAIRLERTICDLFGLRGRWRARPAALARSRRWCGAARGGANRHAYEFLPAEGESLHQIPVGPVHAGIIEPGHFRFTASGETVVRLEERLGYVHKGIEALMRGCGPRSRRAARGPHLGRQHGRLRSRLRPRGRSRDRHRAATARGLAARAHGRAGAHRQPSRRHRRDLQRCRLRADARPLRRACASVALRAADACFGHRLMMDRIVPGGVARDLAPGGAEQSAYAADRDRPSLPGAGRAVRQHRLAAGPHGRHRPAIEPSWPAGSVPAAMSAAPRGAPSTPASVPGYPPYDRLDFTSRC